MSQNRRIRRSIPSLPSGKRMQLFRAVEGVWRDDPVLAAAVRTWRSYEGDRGDLDPVSVDQCPWVRLKLLDRPIVPAAVTLARIDVAIQIEIAVAGTCQEDLVDLWEAFEDATFSFKPYRKVGDAVVTVKEFLRNHAFGGYPDLVGHPLITPGAHGGMFEYRFEEPAFFPEQSGDSRDPSMLAGVGRFVGSATKPA